jgi:hypothetical protein
LPITEFELPIAQPIALGDVQTALSQLHSIVVICTNPLISCLFTVMKLKGTSEL